VAGSTSPGELATDFQDLDVRYAREGSLNVNRCHFADPDMRGEGRVEIRVEVLAR
jgi:hypothetical protein